MSLLTFDVGLLMIETVTMSDLPAPCAPTGPHAPRSEMSLSPHGVLCQSVRKVVPFPVALAGVIAVTEEICKSSNI